MTFVIAPSPFNTATANPAARIHIDCIKDGHTVPVGFLSAEGPNLVDTTLLAQNLADFMNGDNPTKRGVNLTGRDVTMHYAVMPEQGETVTAIAFRFHEHDADGMSLGTSQPVALLTVLPSFGAFLKTQIREKHAIFASVMESVEPERREFARAPGDPVLNRPTVPTPTRF